MALKIVEFYNGFTSETQPNLTSILAERLSTYANDAAYVSAKGSAAAEGDIYGNTTDNTIHYYNGSAWISVASIAYVDNAIDTDVATHAALTATHGVSGDIVGTSDSQTLTNKVLTSPDINTPDIDGGTINDVDFDGGTASNTNRITLPQNTTANLSGLTRKAGTIFYDTTTGSFKGDNGSDIVGLGGGGGGGAIMFTAPDGVAPLYEEEFSQMVHKFGDGLSQELWCRIKVPESYTGAQIFLYLEGYSESTSNTWKLSSTTYLIQADTDAVNSTTNSHASTNSNITNDATQYKSNKITLDLTDASGDINSVGVSAGDILRVKLTRAGGTTDTADVRLVEGSAELKTTN